MPSAHYGLKIALRFSSLMNFKEIQFMEQNFKANIAVKFCKNSWQRCLQQLLPIHDTPVVNSLNGETIMKENKLIDLSKSFAVDAVNLFTEIKENRKSNVLLNQFLRSGTSIGANIHEANY